eukprot:ANDGO_04369.mRNA.1 hypothetical protein SAMD00019534_047360
MTGRRTRVLLEILTVALLVPLLVAADPTVDFVSCSSSATVQDTSMCSTDGSSSMYIFGSNFGNDSTVVEITVDGTVLVDPDIASVSDTLLEIQLPAGPTNAAPTVEVSVGGVLSTAVSFTYAVPVISSAVCSSGGSTCPTSESGLTIHGVNFGNTASGSLIVLSSASGTISAVSCQTDSHTLITCGAFEGAGTAVAVSLTRAVDSAQATKNAAFSFKLPVVSSYSCDPKCSTDGSAAITISGSDFSQTLDNVDYVKVSGVDCKTSGITAVSGHNRLVCQLPAGPGAVNDIVVRIGGQTSASVDFTYAAVQISDAFCTAVGGRCHTSGDTLTIRGSDLGKGTPAGTITLPGALVGGHPTACTVTDSTHTEIHCSGFVGAGSGVDVSITRSYEDDSAATSASKLAAFSFFSPVLLSYECKTAGGSSTDPTAANPHCTTDGAATITLKGTDFGPAVANLEHVFIDGEECLGLTANGLPTVSAGHDKIVCNLPAGTAASAPQLIDVQIGGQALGSSVVFSYSAPTITAATCGAGAGLCDTSGDTITILGTNFGRRAPRITLSDTSSGNNYVQLDPSFPGTAAISSSAHDCHVDGTHTQITCKNFKGAGASVTVVLNRADGTTASGTMGFRAPAISSYSCSTDPTKMGDNNCGTDGTATVTLVGTGFPHTVQNLDEVTFGNVGTQHSCRSTAVILSDTSLECVLPEGPEIGPNTASVEVGLQTTASPAPFSYARPSISAANCNGGVCKTVSDTITLTGRNFGKHIPATGSGASIQLSSGTYAFIDPSSCQSTALGKHFGLTCSGFEGAGVDINVLLSRADAASVQRNRSFSFIPPVVTAYWCSTGSNGPVILQGSGAITDPQRFSFCRTDGTAVITFYGQNFGFHAGHVDTISVGGQSCSGSVSRVVDAADPEYTHKHVTCTLPEQAVSQGTATLNQDLVMTVGSQLTTLAGAFQYRPPTILGTFCGGSSAFGHFAANAYDLTVAPGQRCRTISDTLTIIGDDFGPSNATVWLSRSGIIYSLGTSNLSCSHDAHTSTTRHQIMYCTSLWGVGINVDVSLRRADTKSFSFPSGFSFAAPVIQSYNCSSSGVSGSLSSCDTHNSTITVLGANLPVVMSDLQSLSFGGLRCDSQQGSIPNWAFMDGNHNMNQSARIIASHSAVTCRLPIQSGTKNIEITVADQSSAPFSFQYSPPQVFNYSCSYSDGWDEGSWKKGICGTHDTVVTLRGVNFGRGDETLDITIGGLVCALHGTRHVVPLDYPTEHFISYCRAPEQTGANLTILVAASGQTGPPLNAFTYSQPVLRAVSCSGRPEAGLASWCGSEGTTLTVLGDHFGNDPQLLTMNISNKIGSATATNFSDCIVGQSDCGPYVCTSLQLERYQPSRSPYSALGHFAFSCIIDHGYGANMEAAVTLRGQTVVLPFRFDQEPYTTNARKSNEEDFLFVDTLDGGDIVASAVDMTRALLFAGYSRSSTIHTFEPSVPYTAATLEAAKDIVGFQINASIALFHTLNSQNPALPVDLCFLQITDRSSWPSSRELNYQTLLYAASLLSSHSTDTYPRCTTVGLLMDWEVWKSAFGDPRHDEMYNGTFALRQHPVFVLSQDEILRKEEHFPFELLD